MARIVVIGGGISGLACARGILDRVPDAEVTVLEAGAQPGGAVRSEHAEGFVCEAGAHGFLGSEPATLRLAERLGLRSHLLPADDGRRGRFIFRGGRLHRFPDGRLGLLTSDLLSLRGRARALLEPLVRATAHDGDESVGAFARRRLGHEGAEVLIDPLVCGVYGGEMDRLSMAASAPQLAAMAHGGRSLLAGVLGPGAAAAAKTAPSSGHMRRQLVSFTGGVGQMVRALADSAGSALELSSPVAALRRDGARWRIAVDGRRPRELAADAVVLAVPAPRARSLVGSLDAELDGALASIRYLPTAVAALGFRQPDLVHGLDGFGYLVPHTEGGSVLGVLWSSSMFPGRRSPAGTVLLQAILGGARHPHVCDQPDAQLEDQVCAQLHRALGLRGAPIFRRIFRHPVGIPQYEVGHHLRVERVARAEARLPGLFLTGNAFRGVGISACAADAERVTARVVRDFAERLIACA